MRIALIGTRGVPARYGGFETAAEEVGRRLVEEREVLVRCRAAGRAVVVHRAAVRDREEPRAQVARVGEPWIGGQRLGPGLLRDVVAVAGREAVGESGDVAPVLVDEVLEGGKAHDGATVCRVGV